MKNSSRSSAHAIALNQAYGRTAQARGVWTGEDAKDFIWVLVYTGLRISDVALLNLRRLRGNEVFLRAKEDGGDVLTWIPDWLRDRLQQRAKVHGARLFVARDSDRLETITDCWRRKINRAFELADALEELATPHRFRHTLARILLQRGVPVADVAAELSYQRIDSLVCIRCTTDSSTP
jgi:integrase